MTEQLTIFGKKTELKKTGNKFILYFDGASRNNPGIAGAGICLKKDDSIVYNGGFYLGKKTNNQAEYLALIIGIYFAKKNLQPEDSLKIISDSELIVRQISGIYKIKNAQLRYLYELVMSMLENIDFTIEHVLREYNQDADKNANYAIDRKIPITKQLIDFFNENKIII